MRFKKQQNQDQKQRRRQISENIRSARSASPVFSYRSARHDVERTRDRQSPDIVDLNKATSTKTNGKSLKNKVLKRLVILFFVVSFFVFFSYIKDIESVDIVGGGTNQQAATDYNDTASKIVKKSLLNRSFLVLNRSDFTIQMKKAHPELEQINYVYSPFSRQLSLKLSLNKPVLRVQSGGEIFIADSKGRVIDSTSGDLSALPLIMDDDNRTYKRGDLAFTSKEINYIYNIQGQAVARQMQIDSYTLAHGGTELYAKFKDAGYIVKFALDNDARISFGTFIVSRDKSGDKPKEYIDVRVADRAYIK